MNTFLKVYNKCPYVTNPHYSRLESDKKDIFNTIYMSLITEKSFYKLYLKGLNLSKRKNACNFIMSYYPSTLLRYLTKENPGLVKYYSSSKGFKNLSITNDDYTLSTIEYKKDNIEERLNKEQNKRLLIKLIKEYVNSKQCRNKEKSFKALIFYVTNDKIRNINKMFGVNFHSKKGIRTKFISFVQDKIKKGEIDFVL